jgi:hypothetical protein
VTTPTRDRLRERAEAIHPSHYHVEEDTWYCCGACECGGPSDERRGTCDCGLESRREKTEAVLREVRREALEEASRVDPGDVACPFCNAAEGDCCETAEGNPLLNEHHGRWAAAIRALADAPEEE